MSWHFSNKLLRFIVTSSFAYSYARSLVGFCCLLARSFAFVPGKFVAHTPCRPKRCVIRLLRSYRCQLSTNCLSVVLCCMYVRICICIYITVHTSTYIFFCFFFCQFDSITYSFIHLFCWHNFFILLILFLYFLLCAIFNSCF